MGSNDDDGGRCELDIGGNLYSFLPSATVMDVKQKIASRSNISVWRQNLLLPAAAPPPRQTEMDNDRTLASYGIIKSSLLLLEIDPLPIKVMLRFVGYPTWLDGDFITCYDSVTVRDFTAMIVEKLHIMGLLEIRPEDMVLSAGNDALDDPGAALSDYGVKGMSWITIKFIRNHPPAGTRL
ncbi:unnamed protein product [Linum tenue]|uniref:Ubiquitin-like domain-containing protein n=1 Tax=Linum tenue TaxID=586396 RepID=A0AAV0PH71_9ROSI|nr:unnamed protein product [Linum tenue]